MPDQPDAKQIARVLLYQVTSLRAEVMELQVMVADHMGAQGFDPGAALKTRSAQIQSLRQRLYLDALQEAGIVPSSPPAAK